MRLFAVTAFVLAVFAAASAAATQPAVTSLVLAKGDLPGWRVPAKLSAQTPAAFAKMHHKTLKEIKASGLTLAATEFLVGPGRSRGLSIAARYATPAQARAEALRLHKSNLDADPGTIARPLAVAGIPGALGIRIDGEGARAYDVVFTDGTDLVELFVIAMVKDMHEGPVMKAVRALHDRSLAA